MGYTVYPKSTGHEMVVCPSFKTIQNPLLWRFSWVFWMEKRPASGGIWRSRALSFQGKFHSMVQEPHVDWRVPYGFVWKQVSDLQLQVSESSHLGQKHGSVVIESPCHILAP